MGIVQKLGALRVFNTQQ